MKNTEDLEKLYKDTLSDAAPDFWDKIDAGLKPHEELTEEEKNSMTEFENITATPVEKQEEKTSGVIHLHRPDRVSHAGWIAAAVFVAVVIPAALLLSQKISRQSAVLAEAATEAAIQDGDDELLIERIAMAEAPAETRVNVQAETQAAAQAKSSADAGMKIAAADTANDMATGGIAGTGGVGGTREYGGVGGEGGSAGPVAEEAEETPTGAGTETITRNDVDSNVHLLKVPEDAVTVYPDEESFTEDVLAEADLLIVFTVDSAEFKRDPNGHAYRIVYRGIVEESLMIGEKDGLAGSEFVVTSPIVGSDIPGSTVQYQLVPGQTYVLPLKKDLGAWYPVYPYAPQIRVNEDGSFEVPAGYVSLIDEEAATGVGDGVGFIRADENFLSDLAELIKSYKK